MFDSEGNPSKWIGIQLSRWVPVLRGRPLMTSHSCELDWIRLFVCLILYPIGISTRTFIYRLYLVVDICCTFTTRGWHSAFASIKFVLEQLLCLELLYCRVYLQCLPRSANKLNEQFLSFFSMNQTIIKKNTLFHSKFLNSKELFLSVSIFSSNAFNSVSNALPSKLLRV